MRVGYIWLDLFTCLLHSLFAFYVPIKLWSLRSSSVKVIPSFQGYLKIILTLMFTIVQFTAIIIRPVRRPEYSYLARVPAIASLLAAFALCVLSFFEHRRTARPSSPVIIYLGLSTTKDLVALTVPSTETLASGLVALRLVLELGLLITESQTKSEILRQPFRSLAPEELSGILGRVVFWWIIPVLKRGYYTLFTQDDLPRFDQALSSRVLRKRIIHAWMRRSKPENKLTLPRVLFFCFWPEFLSAIIPRLFLIIFRYSQPILISIAINFLRNHDRRDSQIDSGYWLIILTVIVYCGIAISTSVYQHKLNRLRVMIRGGLVGLIHAQSLRAAKSPNQDTQALTLMSADVDSIDTSAEMFHETWAQLVEVLVGTTLLAKQIGWFAPLPLLIIFGCSRMSMYVAKHLQDRQRNWTTATQARLSMITSVLKQVKSVKILGLEDATSELVLNLRDQEIAMSKRLRWILVAYNASANALGIFSPVLTLVLFAASRKAHDPLTADIIFASIALLGLITHPANMIMTIVPRAIASLANFGRVQNYLSQGGLLDQRVLSLPTAADNPTGVRATGMEASQRPVISLEKVKIQPFSRSSQYLLDPVDLQMNEGAIFMCSGPIGSGKSVLALTILGEMPPLEGTVSIADKQIGFCSQSAWLPTGSIRDVICGGSSVDIDEAWYTTVLEACSLTADLESLVNKDLTWVGSSGINLSGGQKARISLARAVYSRSPIMVLDDPFNALDGKVELHIVNSLLGPDGILRKGRTTVFLITNASQYYPLADKVLLLKDGQPQTLDPKCDVIEVGSEIFKMYSSQKEAESNDEVRANPNVRISASMDDAVADASRRTGDLALYGYYFRSTGIFNALFMTSCAAIYAFCLTFSQYILKWWIESQLTESWVYILSYFLLALMAWIATNGTMWSTHILIAPKSGFTLHARLLERIMHAPLLYFSTFEIGTILNRFGQDIQLVDKELPSALANLTNQVFKMLMQAIILFSVQPAMAMTLPFCAVCVYFIQRIYLRTSRQLRFIELESKSKLYTSFIETVDGIATIRSFGWERKIRQDNIKKLNTSQNSLYLLLCLQRWLNVVLDLLITGIAVTLIASAVTLRGTATGAEIGVALNMIIAANTTLLRLVETFTTMETSLGAVARLKAVDQDTPCEEKPDIDGDLREPPLQWPARGSIQVKGASAGYNPHTLVLRDLNMSVQAGQRIVLCGRTGSGKSSLFLALLRLLTLESGSIEVDGVDISQVSLNAVRRRCFIAVPQDPFILPEASLRFNLDPYNEHAQSSSTTLVHMLTKTGLWLHLSPNTGTTPEDERQFLNKPLGTLPPMSPGQLQVFALVQALLRAPQQQQQQQQWSSSPLGTDVAAVQRKPILILDEASSSVDLDTEARMQQILKESFFDQGYTVIIIAHRLNTVREDLRPGIDAVGWMDNGRLERLDEYRDGLLDSEVADD